jgi:hypothetical protein
MKFKFSSHALEEIQKRKIPIELVEEVLANPQQTFPQDEKISIYQSQVTLGTDKEYLLRLFINIKVDPKVIVTLYRTSQITKYWRIP